MDRSLFSSKYSKLICDREIREIKAVAKLNRSRNLVDLQYCVDLGLLHCSAVERWGVIIAYGTVQNVSQSGRLVQSSVAGVKNDPF